MKTTAEKIDFLMRLTNTSNAALARELNFDASYISRIRCGKRGLPPEQPFIRPACTLFVKRIRDDYQRRALADELGQPWPEKPAKARMLLIDWLETNLNGSNAIEKMVDALSEQPLDSSPRSEPAHINGTLETLPIIGGTATQAQLFFGDAGKRAGVLAFLSRLCETGHAHTLLLHSDEAMTWLFEEPSFSRNWAALLTQLAENGSTIRVIHTISRDANEMWEATRKWIPLYLTGSVESYYYPRLRDGVFYRTLFVACGHSALISNSVRESHGAMVNILLDNLDAVNALETEFNDFLALCRPLVRITFPDDSSELAALISPFAKAKGETLASFENGRLLCTLEDGGALMAAMEPPRIAFKLEEPRMIAAIWQYLKNLPKGTACSGDDARRLLARLANEPQQHTDS